MIDKTRDDYLNLLEEGKHVLDTPNEPNLPERDRMSLEQARALPNLNYDAYQTIPGSSRVTYDTVLKFADVDSVRDQWDREIKEKLETATKLPKR